MRITYETCEAPEDRMIPKTALHAGDVFQLSRDYGALIKGALVKVFVWTSNDAFLGDMNSGQLTIVSTAAIYVIYPTPPIRCKVIE